jgi:hypothetical protein
VTDRKIIAVIGATGAQGGGLVRAMLADRDGGFSMCEFVRNLNSDTARQLARLKQKSLAAGIDCVGSIRTGGVSE